MFNISFAMGVCIALAIFTFIFAYFCSKETQMAWKWFYLCMTFMVMTFSFSIMSKLATSDGYTSIASILDTFQTSLIMITSLLFFLFFIQMIKIAIELLFQKKGKSFKDED